VSRVSEDYRNVDGLTSHHFQL